MRNFRFGFIAACLLVAACSSNEPGGVSSTSSNENGGSTSNGGGSSSSATPGASSSAGSSSSSSESVQIAAIVSRTDLATSSRISQLVNPWGLAFEPTVGRAWISDNGSGFATVHDSGGALLQSILVPRAAGATTLPKPTGMVHNPDATTMMGDAFIIATEDGTIVGWQQSTGAVLRVNAASTNAVYKGAALLKVQSAPSSSAHLTDKGGNAQNGSDAGTSQSPSDAGASSDCGTTPAPQPALLAADFHNARIDVFDTNYQRIVMSNAFTDSQLPAGYAPFNVAVLEGLVFVSYAQQDAAKMDDVKGAGLGFIDVYDASGRLMQRLVSQGALDAPWGMAMAPADFGSLPGRLLVGNFGDGRVNVYALAQQSDGTFVVRNEGVLGNTSGQPLVIDGLWSLEFGPGTGGFGAQQIYFTAGPNNETGGVFGRLDLQVLSKQGK